MRVTIKFFAGFRQGRFTVKECEYRGRITVLQVLSEFSIPITEVGVLIRNGRHIEFDTELFEGDVCSIFPKVGGG